MNTKASLSYKNIKYKRLSRITQSDAKSKGLAVLVLATIGKIEHYWDRFNNIRKE